MLSEPRNSSLFLTRVMETLDKVEYRRADTPEEKDAIFRARYEAYRREDSIPPNKTGLFSDELDESPNVWMIGVYIDGVMASTIRLHVASGPQHALPITEAFPDKILPLLQSGAVVIDVSRQTSRLEFVRAYPFLTLLTMRTTFIAEDYFDADYITVACKPEYQAAFRRLSGCVNWAPMRPYPRLAKPTLLMGHDCRANRHAMRERYPYLDTTPAMQRSLFGRSSTIDRDLHFELTAGRRDRDAHGKQSSTTCVAYASRSGVSSNAVLA